MLQGLLRMTGFLILRIIYGKDSKRPQEFGIGVPLLLSVGFVFWLLSLMLLFAGSAAKDTLICIVFGVGFPLALVIWGILARKKAK